MAFPEDLSSINTNLSPTKLERIVNLIKDKANGLVKWEEIVLNGGECSASLVLNGERYDYHESFEMATSLYLCAPKATDQFMAILRGTSGTGKGTRVCQILEFLKTKYEPVPKNFEFEGKTKQYGLAFEELKLLFVGTVTTSNKSGLSSWSSMDYIHSNVKKCELARPIARQYLREGYSLVLEGEPMMQSNWFRPLSMHPYYGVARYLMPHYWYQDRSQYDERILGRSGKLAGDSGWGRNESYKREWEKTVEEAEELGLEDCHAELLPHDAPLEQFGAQLLAFMGRVDMIEEFVAWTAQNPMLRSVAGGNPLATTKNVFDLF